MNFSKYQGTGNDFILIDDRDEQFPISTKIIQRLCDRRFGIGADGLILLQHTPNFDFKMVYFNSDGNESTMCGNGGRCVVQFASDLGLVKQQTRFLAIDGPHEARITAQNIELQMKDVAHWEQTPIGLFLDTGSPHLVVFKEGLPSHDIVFTEGRTLRNNELFAPSGTNVNFIFSQPEALHIKTYERGVEDETLSCGTGVTAAVLAEFIASNKNENGHYQRNVISQGGALEVSFEYKKENPSKFSQILLLGPAKHVFSGEMTL